MFILPFSIAKHRRPANGRIPVGSVAEERSGAEGRVELAHYVALERNQPTAVLLVPMLTLRLKRAFCPSAVLPPG